MTPQPFKHTFDDGVQEGVQLGIGGEIWRPSVAHPMYTGFFGRPTCGCGKKFKDYQQYKEHYIYQAVWQNEAQFIPKLLDAARKGRA